MALFKKKADLNIKVSPQGYLYRKLPERLRNVYDAAVAGIAAMEKTVPVNGAESLEDMKRVFLTVELEQPQFFYLDVKGSQVFSINQRFEFHFRYLYDEKDTLLLTEQIEEKARFILSQIISEDMTVYDRCLAIHNYMTENIQYNFSALTVSYAHEAYNIDGSILKKRAVCEGIAKGAAYLLNLLGIENILVVGECEMEGRQEKHMWNIVSIEGDYYHIDATWDLQEVNHFSDHSLMYFNLDDEMMMFDHTWELQSYPECSSIKQNYYVRQGCYFRSLRGFELFVQKALQKKQRFMDVKFENTLDIPADGGDFLVKIIRKNAGLFGVNCQYEYIYNPDCSVFQAEFCYL